MTMQNEYRGADNPNNPHESSLGKFLRARSTPVTRGYFGLRNGQIVREETVEHWKREGRVGR